MTDERLAGPNHGVRLIGMLLMAGGALVATLCGLCSLAFASNILKQIRGDNLGELLAGLGLIALVGGVPTVIGIAGFCIGVNILRGRKRRP